MNVQRLVMMPSRSSRSAIAMRPLAFRHNDGARGFERAWRFVLMINPKPNARQCQHRDQRDRKQPAENTHRPCQHTRGFARFKPARTRRRAARLKAFGRTTCGCRFGSARHIRLFLALAHVPENTISQISVRPPGNIVRYSYRTCPPGAYPRTVGLKCGKSAKIPGFKRRGGRQAMRWCRRSRMNSTARR